MITVVCGAEGIALFAVLPQGWKTISSSIQEHILPELVVQKHSRGRNCSNPRYMLHFDDAPVHNTEGIMQILQKCDLLRPEHSPYSPDLSPYEVSVFDCLHEKKRLLSFGTINEREQAITKTIERIPKGTLIVLFHVWRRKLEQCIQKKETTLSKLFSWYTFYSVPIAGSMTFRRLKGEFAKQIAIHCSEGLLEQENIQRVVFSTTLART
jgi:hypothetical protein